MVPLVSIQSLSKSFPGVRALDNCRFELLAGEVHALMGENGAGKSTLMKVLAGVYQKDTGEIRIDGQPVDIPSPRAAQNLGIGIIHQELNLMNHRSVAQNIFIGREPRGRFGLFIDDAENGEGHPEDLRPPASEPGSAHLGRRAHRGQAADGGNRQGPVVRIQGAHHG